jgi:hypothetical protein
LKKLLGLIAIAACASMLFAATSPTKSALGTGSISGVITDSVTGAPITGATVMAGCGNHAVTLADGSYTISGLAAGDYTVKASKCGQYVMKQYPTPVHVDDGQAVTGINIALAPMGGGGGGNGSISGYVYDKATNAPLAGARVTAGGCRSSATTGADGSYTIPGLADGSYTVRAMKNGYTCATYPTPVVITGGAAVTGINFYLAPCNNKALD